MKPYPITCPLPGQVKPLPLIIDGHTHADPDSPLEGNGKFAPFYVFDQNNQKNVAGPFKTRAAALKAGRAFAIKHRLEVSL